MMFLLARLRRSCSLVVICLVFVVLGSALTVVFGQSVTLDCARDEPAYIVCERRSTFMGVPLAEPRTISGLEGAWVEEHCDDDCTYRVVLVADRGDTPLTSSFSSGASAKDEVAREVNAYVDSDQQSSMIQSRPQKLAMWMSLSFVAIGLLLPLFGLLRR